MISHDILLHVFLSSKPGNKQSSNNVIAFLASWDYPQSLNQGKRMQHCFPENRVASNSISGAWKFFAFIYGDRVSETDRCVFFFVLSVFYPIKHPRLSVRQFVALGISPLLQLKKKR